ncbi:MAG TPA: hypothetical protein VHD81_07440 [Mycobacteriales bacterium]|nr:hypothetical protein [Mycobacteriales bacterium]
MALLHSSSSMQGSASVLRVGWEWTDVIRLPAAIPGRTPTVRIEGAGERHAVPEGTSVSLCGRNMQRVDEFIGWRPAAECCEACVQLQRTAS